MTSQSIVTSEGNIIEILYTVTLGDMMVSILLAVLIGVTLLNRLIGRS